MNATEEVDDDRAWSGVLHEPLPDEPIGEQQAEAWARIGLEEEVDRAPSLLCGRRAERGKHAEVERVVQEEHLGWFDNDLCQPEHVVVNKRLNTSTERVRQSLDCWANAQEAEDCHDGAADADRG